MKKINLRLFKQKAESNKKTFRAYLTRLVKSKPRNIEKNIIRLEKEVWKEVDCLSCGNCCKTMTPTFTQKDINRISKHFGETPKEFYKKWLKKDRHGDVVNKKEPCQFLNLKDNKCSIYPIRPADCSGFPHLPKKMADYAHVHKQNLVFCPATYKLLEKMQQHISA